MIMEMERKGRQARKTNPALRFLRASRSYDGHVIDW
jgi:hypothetical protein